MKTESTPNADATVVVQLTEDQRKSVLYALEDKLLETERYLGPEVPDEPGPHHACCNFHLQRYERDKEIYQAMKARKRSIKSTIKIFENAKGPTS